MLQFHLFPPTNSPFQIQIGFKQKERSMQAQHLVELFTLLVTLKPPVLKAFIGILCNGPK